VSFLFSKIAEVSEALENYPDAEVHYKKAIDIANSVPAPDRDKILAKQISNLCRFYKNQGRYNNYSTSNTETTAYDTC